MQEETTNLQAFRHPSCSGPAAVWSTNWDKGGCHRVGIGSARADGSDTHIGMTPPRRPEHIPNHKLSDFDTFCFLIRRRVNLWVSAGARSSRRISIYLHPYHPRHSLYMAWLPLFGNGLYDKQQQLESVMYGRRFWL